MLPLQKYSFKYDKAYEDDFQREKICSDIGDNLNVENKRNLTKEYVFFLNLNFFSRGFRRQKKISNFVSEQIFYSK